MRSGSACRWSRSRRTTFSPGSSSGASCRSSSWLCWSRRPRSRSGAMSLACAGGTAEGLDIDPPARQACVNSDNSAPLARLPVGLMVTNEIEWGPYLVAFTPHSVLAAPYHIRLAASILTANAVFALPPAQARQVVADSRRGLCGHLRSARTGRSHRRPNSRQPLGAPEGRRCTGLARAGAGARWPPVRGLSGAALAALRLSVRNNHDQAGCAPVTGRGCQVLAARRIPG